MKGSALTGVIGVNGFGVVKVGEDVGGFIAGISESGAICGTGDIWFGLELTNGGLASGSSGGDDIGDLIVDSEPTAVLALAPRLFDFFSSSESWNS